VLLLCLLALVGCSGHRAPAAHGLVPWTDEPAEETAQLAQAESNPVCQTAALRLPPREQQWGGVWNDAVAGYFMIENSGLRPCDLPRPSRVTALTPSGTRIPFDVGSTTAPAITLNPASRTQEQISSPYDCRKPLVRSTGFALAFPTGVLHVPRARMAVQCSGTLVDFSARDSGRSASATTNVSPVSRLDARMSQLPATISPGHPVSYSVTLTNPTSTPVTFDQCPAYQEGIKGRPSTVHTYLLNCGLVRQIDAHSSVGFAMQLPLPSQLPSGSAVLNWKLLVPSQTVDNGQFASASSTIEGGSSRAE